MVQEVAELPASKLVAESQEILECAEIELQDDGILFSIECARISLTMIKQFSLIKEELNATSFSLSESTEALQFQKMATWYFLGAAWKLGSQVLNYKVMVKKHEEIIERKDEKFTLCQSQKKKSFWSGLKIGLVIGGGITITFVIVIPMIKALI